MSVKRGWSIGAAALAAVVDLALSARACAQPPSPSDVYGSGPAGTIGRGTDVLPNGPSDWGGGSRGSPPAFGYLYRDFPGRSQFGLPAVQPQAYTFYFYAPPSVGPATSAMAYYYAPRSTAPTTTTYTSSYHPPGSTAPRAPTAPYLTRYAYEPGDGYRYPLYYNPATGGYFYYPVPSRSLATR